MQSESTRRECADPCCPLCTLWSAYRNSDVGKHARGLQREALLLARSLLDAGIRCMDHSCATRTAPPKENLRA